MADTGQVVTIEGRELRLSNVDKPLWPPQPPDHPAYTKGQMVDYYRRVAPFMLPHLSGRAITLRRWPNGIAAASFFEKNCPSHRPAWMPTVTMGDVAYCLMEEQAALVWTANLASIELHPTLARAPDLEAPDFVVFDLDPGPPADILTCARVALLLRTVFDRLSLPSWIKTSGSKGLQVYVPVARDSGYERTRTFAHLIAQVIEHSHADLVVTRQERAARPGKVLIDWSQNAGSKTTICVYSLRPWPTPSVSTPVTWDEVEAALAQGDPAALRFGPDAVLERVSERGDLMAPVLEVGPTLPDLAALSS
jgi:bifunctional non-homologous end joining protein LigD